MASARRFSTWNFSPLASSTILYASCNTLYVLIVNLNVTKLTSNRFSVKVCNSSSISVLTFFNFEFSSFNFNISYKEFILHTQRKECLPFLAQLSPPKDVILFPFSHLQLNLQLASKQPTLNQNQYELHLSKIEKVQL